MKKIVLGMVLAISTLSFANGKEKAIENNLMTNYPVLTDGVSSVTVHEYDVDVEKKKIELEVELNNESDKAAFNNLNKEKLEMLAKEMAKFTQDEAKKNLPVELKIKLDLNTPLQDEVLYEKTF
ncbi:MAG: hypothetical protein ACRCZ9_13105 [Fusobacteriaceae bacterium]